MKIHELTVERKTNKKRLGRGIGSGRGKTAGRGTKGQNSRSGGGVPIGFEGGQTKLAQRLPKVRGFKAQNPTIYQVVNIKDLARAKSAKIDLPALHTAGLVRKANRPVKLLSLGDTDKKLTVAVQAASKSAVAKIEKAGGKVELVALAGKKAQTKKTETSQKSAVSAKSTGVKKPTAKKKA